MAKTLNNKLNEVRQEAIVIIKDFFKENNLSEINCVDICCNPPMVNYKQSLDCVNYYSDTDELTFDASGEYDNDTYGVRDVSTDCLVDFVNFIEFYKEEILEENNEE